MNTIIGKQNKTFRFFVKFSFILALFTLLCVIANLLFIKMPIAKAQIKQTIIVGMDVNFPPMGLEFKWKVTGFDVEIL